MLALVVFLALLGGIYWLCTFIGIPQPFLKIILVVLVVIAILLVLQAFGIVTGGLGSIPKLK